MYLPEKLKADGAIHPQKVFEVSHEVCEGLTFSRKCPEEDSLALGGEV